MAGREYSRARILADSISPRDHRLTTFLVDFWRPILAEFNTHRMFSRNAASSRAIPLARTLELVRASPYIPKWYKNGKGMKAREFLVSPKEIEWANDRWLDARYSITGIAERIGERNIHKGIINRLLEPFMWAQVLVSSTEWENFFALRAHEDAEPHFQDLAYKMLAAYNDSEPVSMVSGQLHIPFQVDGVTAMSNQIRIAVARNARLSYLNFEGTFEPEKDYLLHDDLRDSGHWSPFEHLATCTDSDDWFGNFQGWKQYRKTFPDENRKDPRVIKKRWKR